MKVVQSQDSSYAVSLLLAGDEDGAQRGSRVLLTRTRATEPLTTSDVCEEVAVLGRRVVWAAGKSLRKSLTLQSDVVQQAVWTDFPEYGHHSVLCLLLPGCVTTCLRGGGLQDTPLSSPVQDMRPCTLGLLLGSPHASGVRLVTHPLDEPRPVLADVSLRAGCEGSYAGWSGEEVVWSSNTLPFVVTYSEGAGRLAIWHTTKRAVRSLAVGNLPDLPAATPHPSHLGDSTPLNQVVSRGGHSSHPASAAAIFAVPGSIAAATPPSGGAASAAGSGFSGWPSAMKRPAARTPEGRLSPSLFNPAPRGANTGLSLPALVKAGKAIGGYGGGADARSAARGSTVRGAPSSRVGGGANGGWAGTDASSMYDGAVSSVGVQLSRSSTFMGSPAPRSPHAYSGYASSDESGLPVTGLPGLDGPRPVFRLLYEMDMNQASPGAKPSEGHMATDASGQLLLAVLCKNVQQLLLFTVPTLPSKHPGLHTCHPTQLPALSFALPACSAAAVRATGTAAEHSPLEGRTMELLVLSPKGQLELYLGSQVLCQIGLPDTSLESSRVPQTPHQQPCTGNTTAAAAPAATMSAAAGSDAGGDDMEMDDGMELDSQAASPACAAVQAGPCSPARAGAGAPPQPQVVSLSHAWGHHVSVRTDTGQSLLLDVGLQACAPLQRATLRVLHATLGPAEYAGVLHDLYEYPGACCGEAGVEWEALVQVLLARLQGVPTHTLPTSAPAPGASRPSSGLSARELFDTPQRNRFAAMSLASPASPTIHRSRAPPAPPPTNTPTPPQAATPAHPAPQPAPTSRTHPHPHATVDSKGRTHSTGVGMGAGGSAWSALMGSQLHADTVAAGRYPWMAADAKVNAKTDAKQTAALTAPMGVYGDSGGGNGAAGLGNTQQLQPVDAGKRAQGVRVLHALHALYEDCKLDTFRWSLLLPLARALARFAVTLRAHAYWEHYTRDVGAPLLNVEWHTTRAEQQQQQQGSQSSSSARPGLPLDVCRVLSRMLHGCPPPPNSLPLAEPSHSSSSPQGMQGGATRPGKQDDQQSGVSDPLPASCMPCTLRLLPSYQHLMHCSLRCSEIIASQAAAQGGLASSTNTSRSSMTASIAPSSHSGSSSLATAAALHAVVRDASRSVVLSLLAEGWSPTELSSVPLGVGLPLQEALQRCRADPPQGWPPEAYALIGREDIAATLAAAAPSSTSTRAKHTPHANEPCPPAATSHPLPAAMDTHFGPTLGLSQPPSFTPIGSHNHATHSTAHKQQHHEHAQQQPPNCPPLAPPHTASQPPPETPTLWRRPAQQHAFAPHPPLAATPAGQPYRSTQPPADDRMLTPMDTGFGFNVNSAATPHSPSPSPWPLPRTQLNLATPMLPHSSLPTPREQDTQHEQYVSSSPMRTSLSTPMHAAGPGIVAEVVGGGGVGAEGMEGVQAGTHQPHMLSQQQDDTGGHVTFALPPSPVSAQPHAQHQYQQLNSGHPAPDQHPSLPPTSHPHAVPATPLSQRYTAAPPTHTAHPSASSPAVLAGLLHSPAAGPAHDSSNQATFGAGAGLGKRGGKGGSRGARNWTEWRPPYAHRLHLPVHHLDVGTRRAHLLAAAVQGGHGARGQAGSAGQSVGPEALRLQEMWDSLEGLRRGATRLRFSRDARLNQVSSLLSSSSPVVIHLDVPEMDPSLPTKQQHQLLAAAARTMVLSIGRGALTLGTARPLPTEPLVIPPLCLSGLAAQHSNATISLDLSTAQNAPGGGAAADLTAWAEFHNGAASGLRMAAEHEDGEHSRGSGSVAPLTRNWIVYHRPESPSYTHAGLLMALGLAGHLAKLSWTDLYRYLSEQHDATTIGVLLGMAASQRSSMDALVSKMLFLHLPATHPASFPEIELSPLVQASALLGVGLLYQGSCHRLMVETMLAEIGRRPSSCMDARAGGAAGGAGGSGTKGDEEGGVVKDREGYALAAGLSLGLVALGAGRNAAGLADLNLEKRLRFYMLGAAEAGGAGCSTAGSSTSPTAAAGLSARDSSVAGRPGGWGSSSLAGTGAGGFSRVGFDPSLGEERMHEMAALHLAGLGRSLGAGRDTTEDGGSVPAAGGTTARLVLEDHGLNLGVSAPGATLALALMYLKTDDAAVASSFVIPDTLATLQAVRPDLLTLRVLGRALVLWSGVQPSLQWVETQMAPIFRAPLSAYLDRLAHRRAPPPAPGSQSPPWASTVRALRGMSDADVATLGHAHLAALAGACLALGLRYAGSGNSGAHDVLHHYVQVLLEAKKRVPDAPPVPVTSPMGASAAAAAPPTDPAATSAAILSMQQIDKGPLESCLCVVVAALAVVMAGSGHLPTLRLVQALSQRCHPVHSADVTGLGITVGSHMMINMAAGFLFLGAGNATFSTSNSAIAALLIALHPRIPLDTLDNSCHLQAFRHLYVLAAEPRCVEARDVDSKQLVYVPLGITTAQQQEDTQRPASSSDTAPTVTTKTTNRFAPCLLPEKSEVVRVAALGPRYWPQVLSRMPTQLHPSHPSPLLTQHASPTPTQLAAAGQVLHPTGDIAGTAAMNTPAQGLHTRQQQQEGMLIDSPGSPECVTPAPWQPDGSAGTMVDGITGVPAVVSSLPSHPSSLAHTSALDRLYQQQLVFVKKRSGSLSYADDPSGIRSLLSRVSVLHTGSTQGAAAPPPLLLTSSMHTSSHHTSQPQPNVQSGEFEAGEAGGGVGLQPGTHAGVDGAGEGGPGGSWSSNDMVHLCATFSADPSIMALAQLLKQLGALQHACSLHHYHHQQQQQQQWSGQQWRSLQRRQCSALLHFCTNSLYECITAEKAELLAAYLKLYCLVLGYSQDGCPAWLSGTGLLTTALRALPLSSSYYASPLATACSMVASRPTRAHHAHQHEDSSSFAGGSGASGAGEHQQLWRPLLQPALMEGLWMRVRGVWAEQGAILPPSSASYAGTATAEAHQRQPWVQAVCAAAGLAPPAQQQSGEAVRGEQQRACVGMCLQLSDAPYGEELRAAVVSLQSSPMWAGLQAVLQSAVAAGVGGGKPGSEAVISMALVPLLAAKMPRTPPAVLRELGSLLPALLS